MAAPDWPVERGTLGELHFHTHPIESLAGERLEEVVVHTYLGDWQGMRCFADDDGLRIYLHPDEIVSFLAP